MKREPEVKKILKILTDFVTVRAITVSGVTFECEILQSLPSKGSRSQENKKVIQTSFVFFFGLDWIG